MILFLFILNARRGNRLHSLSNTVGRERLECLFVREDPVMRSMLEMFIRHIKCAFTFGFS